MSIFITQCPHCQTAFRTSMAQLQAADGNVRCGACLNVFIAEDNLLDNEEYDFAANSNTQDLAAAVEDEEADEVTELNSDVHEEEPNRSDSEPAWEMLEESEQDTETEPDFELEPAQQENFYTSVQLADEDESLFADDTLLAETLEKETLFDEPEVYEAQADETLNEEALVEEPLIDDARNDRPEPKLFAERDSLYAYDLLDEDAPESFNESNRASLHDVSAPVVLDARQRKPRSVAAVLGASLLCVLLAATLVLQVLWQQRDALSQAPQWRPAIVLMCNWFSCQVAEQRDLAAISSENLLVRSHPSQRGALQVTLSFSNQADFAQPFPLLTVRFTDKDNNTVAMRRFLPAQYLQEELQNMPLLPPKALAQASLDIVDPGTAAVNYEVLLEFAD